MINPASPSTKIPTAETFEIVLNSCELGFLRIFQTLIDCIANDFSFLCMLFKDLKGLKN